MFNVIYILDTPYVGIVLVHNTALAHSNCNCNCNGYAGYGYGLRSLHPTPYIMLRREIQRSIILLGIQVNSVPLNKISVDYLHKIL